MRQSYENTLTVDAIRDDSEGWVVASLVSTVSVVPKSHTIEAIKTARKIYGHNLKSNLTIKIHLVFFSLLYTVLLGGSESFL